MVIKKLLRSIREYKKTSILTPLLVSCEVVLECTIPFYIAELVNRIKDGAAIGEIAKFGGILVLMAIGSLLFGMLAGFTCATASCGFGKNLRKDLYSAVNDFSFPLVNLKRSGLYEYPIPKSCL